MPDEEHLVGCAFPGGRSWDSGQADRRPGRGPIKGDEAGLPVIFTHSEAGAWGCSAAGLGRLPSDLSSVTHCEGLGVFP